MYKGCLVWYLVVAMFVIGIAPRVEAAFAPSGAIGLSAAAREGDLEKIRVALEHRIVMQRLHDLGYTPAEIMARVSEFSDDQIHNFAQRLDQAKVGGDGVGFVIAVLLVIVLVLLILHLAGHRVSVR